MEQVKAFWNSLPWYTKILCAVLVPVALFLCLFESGRRLVLDFIETKARGKVDAAENALTKESQQLSTEEAALKGNVDQLEKDKLAAEQQAATKDDAAFFNERDKK